MYAALIVLAGVLTYANSLSGPFIFDDRPAIEKNQTIERVWAVSTVLPPPRETPVGGCPVVNLSLAVNYALGGLDPVGYHVWNIAVHLCCALLLFGIVRRTLDGPGLRGRFGGNGYLVTCSRPRANLPPQKNCMGKGKGVGMSLLRNLRATARIERRDQSELLGDF